MIERFLEETFQYGAEYGEKLSNHLPMALFALMKMGATEERLKKFMDFYTAKLELKGELVEPIDVHHWNKNLGKHNRNSDYSNFFQDEVKTHGVEAILKKYLPPLMEGVGGAAFHPLIRVAYGIESQCEREIGEGLSSWCMAYLPLLPIGDEDNSYEKVTDCLIEVISDPYFKSLKIKGPNIFSRMEIVGKDKAFKKFSNPLPKRQVSLEELSLAALHLYASTNDNFEALHVVTSTHALRIVRPYISDFDRALRFYWQAVCAIYITIGCPQISPLIEAVSLPEWDSIFKKACLSNNDHVIKFVYTCWEEERHYGRTLYRQYAAKKAGLL